MRQEQSGDSERESGRVAVVERNRVLLVRGTGSEDDLVTELKRPGR